jgi:hypothetical protein
MQLRYLHIFRTAALEILAIANCPLPMIYLLLRFN